MAFQETSFVASSSVLFCELPFRFSVEITHKRFVSEKMQRGREVRGNSSSHSGRAFDSFGLRANTFPSIFGGRDPFDDQFFNRPLGSLFGSNSPYVEPWHASRPNEPVIEELDGDDEKAVEEDENDEFQGNVLSNRNPLVEHPEDQSSDHGNSKVNSKEVANRSNHKNVEGTQPQSRSISFHRVTYGGIDGFYYTSTTTRRAGSDGVTLEESKQADRTTGQASHRISRGIHDKGHSLTRKLDSDGKLDTMQTLHNLDEDELASFEQAWKGNADRHLPGWNAGFDLHSDAGTTGRVQNDPTAWRSFSHPFSHRFGGDGIRPGRNSQAQSSSARSKKVVTINIE